MRITFNVMTDESDSGIPAGNGNEKQCAINNRADFHPQIRKQREVTDV